MSEKAQLKEQIPLPAQAKAARKDVPYLRYLVLCCLGLTAAGYHLVDTMLSPIGSKHHAVKIIDAGLERFSEKRMTARGAEKLFLSVPNGESAVKASREYTAVPHIAGAPADYDSALTILSLYQQHFNIPKPSKLPVFEAGSIESRNATLSIPALTEPTAWIDTYYPLLNYPLERKLEILGEDGKVTWSADVEERQEDGDESGQYAHTIGAWHGLSKGGDVTGRVVYVNYGRFQDFEALAAAGVSAEGKIALVRYGEIMRGLKVKAAQEAGFVGTLIYSDPRDDGSVTVENGFEAYPHGPARNPTAVERGSVQFISMFAGDPTTPGYPAYKNATRGPGTNMPSIPSLPVSWANAQRLLEEIKGSPKDKFTIGGTTTSSVRLLNQVNNTFAPIWNSMAVIPGHVRDEVVIVGNHRDAWVMGAADPTSGTVSVAEIVRGLGELLKQGWKPLRTIVLASWDAEEYGLIGSTEYGEDFADWLKEHVVAYLNIDLSAAGSQYDISGSPSLAHLVRDTAREIPHPTHAHRSLLDARGDSGPFHKNATNRSLAGENCVKTGKRPYCHARLHAASTHAEVTGVHPLGSGSDYTVFLQRIGIASADQGFGPSQFDYDAVYHYHSVYDSETWQERYGDPGFHRHVAVAKHLGLMALRLADSIIIPLNTTQYSLELMDYLEKVEDIASSFSPPPNFSHLRESIHRIHKASLKLDHGKEKAEKALTRAADKWSRNRGHLCLRRSLEKWIKAIFGAHVNETTGDKHDRKLLRNLMKAARRVHSINKKLSSFESGFISEEGIRDREWYRHLGVAPGKWLGYGATTFPALTEALQIEKNVTLAEYEADRLGRLIGRLSKSLNDY